MIHLLSMARQAGVVPLVRFDENPCEQKAGWRRRIRGDTLLRRKLLHCLGCHPSSTSHRREVKQISEPTTAFDVAENVVRGGGVRHPSYEKLVRWLGNLQQWASWVEEVMVTVVACTVIIIGETLEGKCFEAEGIYFMGVTWFLSYPLHFPIYSSCFYAGRSKRN